jgi:uncharacterized membrane protein YgcG
VASSQSNTRQLWAEDGAFISYEIPRGPRNVPQIYTKGATWRVAGEAGEGYYAQSNTDGEPERYYPVEFNTERVCWVEIRWIENLETGGHWEAFRSAGEDLNCDITREDVELHDAEANARNQQAAIVAEAHRRAPSNPTTPSRPETPTSDTSSRPSLIQVLVNEPDPELTQLAESLRITDFPQMSQTATIAIQAGTINPETGHVTTDDDIALYRAIGPDQADPPTSFHGRGSSNRRPHGGGFPGGGFPGGGFPGGGFPGGGFPGGGFPGGNPPGSPGPPGPHLPHVHAAPNQGNGKLVGNPPDVFAGDRAKAEQFLTQWD